MSPMIRIKNFPPRTPEDVEFTDATNLIIESMGRGTDPAREEYRFDSERLHDLGDVIGRFLCANVDWESYETPQTGGDALRSMARGLTLHWDGDAFDEQFHVAFNEGIQVEYAHNFTTPQNPLDYEPGMDNLI